MIRIRLALGTAACVLGLSSSACAQPAPRTITPAQWREDLATLVRELPKRHANAFHTAHSDSFARAAAALGDILDTASRESAVVGFARLVATVGDLHTRVFLPAEWSRLAVAFTWFGCGSGSAGPCELRVTAAAPGSERALGAKVVAIGGIPVEQAHNRVAAMIAQGESEGAVWYFSATYLQLPQVLRGLGLEADTNGTVVTLEDSAGTFAFRSGTTPRQAPVAAWPSAEGAASPTRARAEPVWWSMLPDSHTVYLAFDSYPDKGALRKQMADLVAFADARGARRLVIDLRRNRGGDFTKGREIMIPSLQRHRVLGRRGAVYALIGPGTYSAAMTNAVDLRSTLGATLVGLPTGSRPNGYQEGRQFTLPRSRLEVAYATRLYRFEREDTPGVIPDQRMEQTWTEFRDGRDPALVWVMGRP